MTEHEPDPVAQTRPTVSDLAAARDALFRRTDLYHGLGPIAGRRGWELWLLCARNAAWAGLLAGSWHRVSELVPEGLLRLAAINSMFHFDAERHRWRALALDVARDDRCHAPAPGTMDLCTLVTGHPGGHRGWPGYEPDEASA